MSKGLLLGSALIGALVLSCSSSTDSGDPITPTGEVTAFTDCKDVPVIAASFDLAPSQGCIEYAYDGDSVLALRHINAGFNCCPDSFTATFGIEGRRITISEVEWLTNPCDCLCLYDLDMKISNLPAGTWTITVVESYLWQGAALLEFTVDLTATPTGQYCVLRDRYPWGMP